MENNVVKNNQSRLLYFIIMFSIVILSSILSFSFSVLIIQLILLPIVIILIHRKDSKTILLYTIIFCISICFVYIIYFSNNIKYGNPYYIGGSDDLLFEKQGIAIYNSNLFNPKKILENNIIDSWSKHSYFVIYISALIRFSELFNGFTTLIPRIVNVYLLLFICMILEYLLKKYAFFSNKKIKITIAVFALNPNIQYINSHVFRDTFNLLQIFLIIYLVDKLMNYKNIKLIRKLFILIILILTIYTTFYTRPNSLVFAGMISAFIILEKMKIKKIYFLIACIFLLIFSNFLELIGLDRFIRVYRDYNLASAGDGLSSFIFKQPMIPFGVIFRTFYAFITPFPNFFILFKDITSLLYDLVFLLIYSGVLVSALFIPFLFKRMFKLDWLAFSFALLFFGTILTTYTFRHILLYYPFMVAAGVDGFLTTAKWKRKWILFIDAIFIVLLGLLYICLKLFA